MGFGLKTIWSGISKVACGAASGLVKAASWAASGLVKAASWAASGLVKAASWAASGLVKAASWAASGLAKIAPRAVCGVAKILAGKLALAALIIVGVALLLIYLNSQNETETIVDPPPEEEENPPLPKDEEKQPPIVDPRLPPVDVVTQPTIAWDNLKDGDEYVIKKANGEPLMTLIAVTPGTFVLGHPLIPAPPKPQKKTTEKFDPIQWYLHLPKAEPDSNIYLGKNGYRPYPQVTLTQTYFIAQTEVTIEQYKYVMEIWNKKRPHLAVNTTPSVADAVKKNGIDYYFGPSVRKKQTADAPEKYHYDFNPAEHHVDHISWQEAMYFCQALEESGLLPPGSKCSLPTEIQFEFAARGGNKEYKKFYKYSGTNERKEVILDSKQPYRVKQAKPNGLNIYGLSNDIWEWCLDDYVEDIADLKPEFRRFYLDKSESYRSMRGAYLVIDRRRGTRRRADYNVGVIGVSFRIVLLPNRPIKEKETIIYKPTDPQDTTPPVITPIYPESNKIISGANPKISARVTDAADKAEDKGSGVKTVVIKVDGKTIQSGYHIGFKAASGRLYARKDGNYKALKDGEHTVEVTAEDNAENKSEASWKFTVDSTPPQFSNLVPAPDSVVTDDEVKLSVKITDAISGVAASSLIVRIDDWSVDKSFDPQTGIVTLSSKKLKPGIHKVYVEVRDEVGNYGTTTWTFKVKDTTPPEITHPNPKPDSLTKNNNLTISAKITDTQSGVDTQSITISLDGKTLATGKSSATARNLPDGSHTATISAKDKDGNPASLSWKFTIDTKPPVISNYVPQNNRSVMAGRKVIRATISDSLSGIDESSIVVKINGKKVTHQYHSSTGHVTAITDRLEGVTCSVYISVKDKAGNTAHANWKFTTKNKKKKEYKVDSTTPSISALTPENKSTVNITQVEIGATVKDSESGISAKSIVLKVDGKKVQHSFDAASGRVSFTSQNLKPGRHKLYIYVEDVVGNKASTNCEFTVNDQKEYTGNAPTTTSTPTPTPTPAPASTLTINRLTPPNRSTVNAPQVEISATVQALKGVISAKSIVLKVDGKKVQHRFDAAFGKVSFTSQNLKPGRHKLYIYVEDVVGNKASKIWTFTKKP